MSIYSRAFFITGAVAATSLAAYFGLAASATAQSSAPATVPSRFATIDLLDIVERMVISERYAPARTAFSSNQRESIQPIIGELQEIQQQGQALQQGTPEFEALVEKFSNKQQQLQSAQEDAQRAIADFESKQVGEAYALANESAVRMAERLGYTHVIASRANATIRSNNVPAVVQEILARPMVLSPKSDDLTKAMITELKLEDVKTAAEMPKPDADPEVAPATTPDPATTPATTPTPAKP